MNTNGKVTRNKQLHYNIFTLPISTQIMEYILGYLNLNNRIRPQNRWKAIVSKVGMLRLG